MNKQITIEKAYKMNSRGMDVQDGWDVMIDGNWGNRYCTKRDAIAAVIEDLGEEVGRALLAAGAKAMKAKMAEYM